jgi:hypothetical protein
MFTCGPQTAPFLAVAAFLAQFLLRQAQQLLATAGTCIAGQATLRMEGEGIYRFRLGLETLAMAAICTFMLEKPRKRDKRAVVFQS